MLWGFGCPSNLDEAQIRQASRLAFELLRMGRISEAAMTLCGLRGIGISRATKVLALSNQTEYGIYDSRAAHGLSDLSRNGKHLIPIPPGRSVAVRSDHGDKARFCRAYRDYTLLLRHFRDRAKETPALAPTLRRAADIEMALFARSRSGLVE